MSNVSPIFEASADAKTIASLLRIAPVGGVVSYDDMTCSIERSVLTDAKGVLNTARYIVQREDKMIFDAVRGVGLKRLADEDIVDLSDKARDHVRRTSKKLAKKLTCVNYDSMSKDKQTKHNTALSMFGVFCELATDKSTNRLQSFVLTAGIELPVAKASIAALGLLVSA